MVLHQNRLIKKLRGKKFRNVVTSSKKLAVSQAHWRLRSSFVLAVLILAGYAGNYFNLSLFFGVDFLFGSIAVLMVVWLYGIGWGAVAAMLAGSHTFLLWGHPYAGIILIGEALFVGWWRRKCPNLLLLDGFYWIFVGMPLVWLFYSIPLGVPSQTVFLVMFKQGINGIFNALIASLLLTHSPIPTWADRPKIAKTLSLQQTLFNLLVAFVLFPALTLLVLNSRSAISNMEKTIQANLETVSTDLAIEVRFWHQQNLNALKQLAEVAVHSDIKSSIKLQESTELLQRTFSTIDQLFVMNREGQTLSFAGIGSTIASYSELEKTITESIGMKASDLTQPSITSQVLLIDDHHAPPRLVQIVPIIRNYRLVGSVVSEIDLSHLAQLLKSFTTLREMEITLLDRQDRVITSTRLDMPTLSKFKQRQGGEIRPLNDKVYQWLPLGEMPIMMRWKKSFYVQKTSAGEKLPFQVIVAVPTQPHFIYLENLYIKSLSILLLITALALAMANVISRWLAQPLLQLAELTTDLPDKLLNQKAIHWPNSWITEMNTLVSNSQFMAELLEQKFHEINAAKEQLEQRVQERTRELSTANQELELEVSKRQRVAEALQESEALLRTQAKDLETALYELQHTQAQLIQTEKMSSLGQLVAGVAHEINNPINFIYGNLIHAQDYTQDLLRLVELYQQHCPNFLSIMQEEIEAIDLDFLKDDLPKLMDSMQVGAERIHEIVQSLRSFSRLDEAEVKAVDIHEGIDSTLMILKSRLKATLKHPGIEVIKEYGQLPLVECYPGQLNQVFMNILVNSIDSLEDKFTYNAEENRPSLDSLPWIRIYTEIVKEDWVAIRISDNGMGIKKDQSCKLFDPFFTTKPIGKGTGLGLSISYQIIVEKHGGKLYCVAEPKQGAEFMIEIPLRQTRG
ncbi:histidine kinase [Allocoleopsis franciscana PCC 7113]|uniref:histidine kinase n=1 Tax=Allocoleopsis franciscana PCC 7113 TaxID=1173027 RepID=K9WDL1_9CYAN|nr:histidine kinase [Allocoleopsis franciscana PCC 7113]